MISASRRRFLAVPESMKAAVRRDPPDGVPLLDVKGLVKEFGGVRAVDGVDLSVGVGEMRCIIGPNGCGKTTLFNLITGYLPATEGSILFDGRDISGMAMHEIAAPASCASSRCRRCFPISRSPTMSPAR